MPKTKAKPKSKVSEVIEPLSREIYENTFKDLCHFSFKTANSNAKDGGIRLSTRAALKLPYVAVRTLMGVGQDIPLDYIKNSGPTATAVKHWRLAQKPEGAAEVPNRTELLRIFEKATTGTKEIGTDAVPERLRQILAPKDNTYVALTPLTAAGLMDHLQTALEPYRWREDAPKRFPNPKHAFLGIGGSNPQNVGSLVRSMQRPLFFTSPQEKPEIRKAYAIYYQGASLDIPKIAMDGYRVWRVALMVKNGGTMPTNARIRAEETAIQLGILRRVFYRLEALREFMTQHQQITPGDHLICPNLPKIQQGLFDRKHRDGAWENEFSTTLSDRISLHTFSDGAAFYLSEAARKHLAELVKEHMPWK